MVCNETGLTTNHTTMYKNGSRSKQYAFSLFDTELKSRRNHRPDCHIIQVVQIKAVVDPRLKKSQSRKIAGAVPQHRTQIENQPDKLLCDAKKLARKAGELLATL